jgi:hypothetical protein
VGSVSRPPDAAEGHKPDCNCATCEPYTEWLGEEPSAAWLPWYARNPVEAFIRSRPEYRGWLAHVWIITGWRWASVLLRRCYGR